MDRGRRRVSAAAFDAVSVRPTAAGTVDGEAGGTWRADPRFAGDGYVLLDSQRVGPDDLRHDNAAALLAGLENPLPSTLPELVGAVCRRLRAPELRGLREIGHCLRRSSVRNGPPVRGVLLADPAPEVGRVRARQRRRH